MGRKSKITDNFSSESNCMDGLYAFHEELGCGGFGKVKLAIHMLTGEKVAVKIIDKKAIGDDLPRVTTELDALKSLAHQNICRLFQYTETEDKFYIVMEYCNGGEMFDYIVKKARLEESEARYFFRQLVQAIAYVHSMGFAHRDLKPENLLLKEDLQLKVIDFGLSAKPKNGLGRPLETCCGSPAYAAPELIQNTAYYGNEADVWSMGVLLYALLCGALPFEDESLPKLYRKITLGVYHEPTFLSPESRDLLKAMLTVNPRNRITIKQLLVHPWLNKNYLQPLKWSTVYDKNLIDEEIAREMAFYFGMYTDHMMAELKKWRFDYLTSTYIVLLQRKERKQNFTLPLYRRPIGNVVHSPTIHASLESDLDQYSRHTEEVKAEPAGTTTSGGDLPFAEKSYVRAVTSDAPASIFCHSPQIAYRNLPPVRTIDFDTGTLRTQYDKENQRPATAAAQLALLHSPQVKVVVPHQQQGSSEGLTVRPASIYSTPKRGAPSPAMYHRRPKSVERTRVGSGSSGPTHMAATNATKPHHCPPHPFNTVERGYPSREQRQWACAGSPSPISATTPVVERESRSQTKTSPRLRQRLFTSLERKADRVINLLTPKKMRFGDGGPARLSSDKTMVNVSITSSADPHFIRGELLRVLDDEGMDVSIDGWKISGSKRGNYGNNITVELEVVLIENLHYVGVRRRRVNGDAMTYKRVCEQILSLAGV